jgi:hypothetical protein
MNNLFGLALYLYLPLACASHSLLGIEKDHRVEQLHLYVSVPVYLLLDESRDQEVHGHRHDLSEYLKSHQK